ncbi:hypothetical protein CapIbe_011833 [Capra ibex]
MQHGTPGGVSGSRIKIPIVCGHQWSREWRVPFPCEELPTICPQCHRSRVHSALEIWGKALGLAAWIPFSCSDC